MANIGAGEILPAYLIKENVVTDVDSMLKDTVPTETILNIEGVYRFKYRHLTDREMTFQPISGYLKGKFDKVLFTSETDISFNERDLVLFPNGDKLRIERKLPQTQHGAFLVNQRPPHILELA